MRRDRRRSERSLSVVQHQIAPVGSPRRR
jgi:hypothetical protein